MLCFSTCVTGWASSCCPPTQSCRASGTGPTVRMFPEPWTQECFNEHIEIQYGRKTQDYLYDTGSLKTSFTVTTFTDLNHSGILIYRFLSYPVMVLCFGFSLRPTNLRALYPWHTLTQHTTRSWFDRFSPRNLQTMFPPRLKPTTTKSVWGKARLM